MSKLKYRVTMRLIGVALASVWGAASAWSLTIDLKGTASDRIERQRAFIRGELPLPGTPDLSSLQERLSKKGLVEGAPVFIRAFKAESQIELWMRKGKSFVHFATYPICHWDGEIGPKLAEGDRQTPEGFYTVSARQFKPSARWRKRFNLGYPNAYDRAHKRTGSNILVHGGCSSVGCFAMTDEVVDEIHRLSKSALKTGQKRFQFHIYPFRMTAANISKAAKPEWKPFWTNLKRVNDVFEQTRRPPKISVCNKRYMSYPAPEFGLGSERIRSSCTREWQPNEAIAQVDEFVSTNIKTMRVAYRSEARKLRKRRSEERKAFLRKYAEQRVRAKEKAKQQRHARMEREKSAQKLAKKLVMLDVKVPSTKRVRSERQTLKPSSSAVSNDVADKYPRNDVPAEILADEALPKRYSKLKVTVIAPSPGTEPVTPVSRLEKKLIERDEATGDVIYKCDFSKPGCRKFIEWTERKARYRKLKRAHKRQQARPRHSKVNKRHRTTSKRQARKNRKRYATAATVQVVKKNVEQLDEYEQAVIDHGPAER